MPNNTPPPCPGCGRAVALRTKLERAQGKGGKHRHRHKCPHGKWCVAGFRTLGQEGWNPGGSLHQFACAECAREARAEYARKRDERSR